MRAGRRRSVTTLAVAVVVAAVVVGAGYGLERSVLRAPTRGELVAAEVQGNVAQYRYITSEVHISGSPTVRGECLEGWQHRARGRPAGRGARVAFSDGERLIVGDRRILRLEPSKHPSRLAPVAEIELAGCGRLLTNHISAHLVGGHRVYAVPATFRGMPVMKLHVRTLRTRFDLYAGRGYKKWIPVAIRVTTSRGDGWSLLKPVMLTPERKRAFVARFND
jgi:hypothetical protein